MIARQDILDTLRMVEQENLDVRTVTLGINLNVCAGRITCAEVARALGYEAVVADELLGVGA